MDPTQRKQPASVGGRPRAERDPAPIRNFPPGMPFMSCGECSYTWLPRTAKPIKCPRCQAKNKLELVA